MKVKGYKTESVDVDVNPGDILSNIWEKWLRNQRSGDYISKDGCWKEEHHTSHSYTVDRDKATEDQIKINLAFETILELLKTFKT